MLGILDMAVEQKSTSPRILVVDDEPRWLRFAREDLGVAFNVEVVTNLRATLKRLRKNGIDLVVVSARCPEILEALTEKWPGKPVVVATGQPTTREAISMYRRGALDYFAKDLRREVLSARIDEAIRKPIPAY